MEIFPFQLVIIPLWPKKQAESIECTCCLRSVAGRRKVYAAKWGNRNVVVKVFNRRIGAKRHIMKEWEGLKTLLDRNINAPRVLLRGKTESGQWIIVIEMLENTTALLDVLDGIKEPKQKVSLLLDFTRELANQHKHGVIQEDLHLGNYLYDGKKIYAIDPWQIRFVSGDVPRRKSISHLALFVRYLPPGNEDSAKIIFDEYFKARGWKAEQQDLQFFERMLIYHKKSTVEKGLRKCLRTSKRYLRVKGDGYKAVFARGFCEKADPKDLISRIDQLMDGGEIFKKGNTAYVSRIQWNGKDVIVKRYNHKGIFHSLRHSLMRSRACQGWLHGHRLEMLGIPTPTPLAYIEQYKGLILWQSYLITEYVTGPKLYAFMNEQAATRQQSTEIIDKVEHLLSDLHQYKISHGDLKHTNILLTKRGPVIIDLDGLRVHKMNWTYRRRREKDLKHFADGGRGAYAISELKES